MIHLHYCGRTCNYRLVVSYTTKLTLQRTTAGTLNTPLGKYPCLPLFTITSTLRTDLKEFFQKNCLFLVEMSFSFGHVRILEYDETETILFGKSQMPILFRALSVEAWGQNHLHASVEVDEICLNSTKFAVVLGGKVVVNSRHCTTSHLIKYE